MPRSFFVTIAFIIGALVACGGNEAGPQPGGDGGSPNEQWPNRTPQISVISPNQLAVGERVVALGTDFIPSAHGRIYLHFQGNFQADDGNTYPVDKSFQARVVDNGKIDWKMWPNVVFHPSGDSLGSFVGQVRVVNQGKDGSEKPSQAFPVTFSIKPSLIPQTIQPLDQGCQDQVITDTVADQGMVLNVKAIGLKQPTPGAPITFHWVFQAEQWDITFNHGTFDTSSVIPKTGPISLEAESDSSLESIVIDGGTSNLAWRIGADAINHVFGSAELQRLKTKPIETGSELTTVNVLARDAEGTEARLAIELSVHPTVTMGYDGTVRTAQYFNPQRVTDCIPGGNVVREVSYSESQSESRSRSLGINFNFDAQSTLAPLGLINPANQMAPFISIVNFSAGFGVNVNESASSDKSEGATLSAQMLPQKYGVFYRQTVKMYRIGTMYVNTACGKHINFGEAVLTDWVYKTEFVMGPNCSSDEPRSSLPPAQMFLE